MPAFLDHNFLLQTETARRLYHEFAAPMPVIDYHNHLPPADIAGDRIFSGLTEAWLEGDHYKWRAMRANGIPEAYITGNKTPEEKFLKWAETVPYTLRNPLYHWTHLELRRYFGIEKLLSPKTAPEIYQEASEKLRQPECSARRLLKKMNVQVVCTTDDPVDSLEHHRQFKAENTGLKMLPTFRPDRAMAVENTAVFNEYLDLLESASNTSIATFAHFTGALRRRHDYFAGLGCKLSDHGLETFYAGDFAEKDLERIFEKLRSKTDLKPEEVLRFKSGMLVLFAQLDFEKGWTQQFHTGPLRDTNPAKLRALGPNTGYDSIGDSRHGAAMARFFARLDERGHLPKTIVYNINPADNYLFAGMCGNFQDGSPPGKIQYGAAWWFLDQKEGIEAQLNALSNLGLLSRFVGMLTDSRSFLSFPRHEYFRRILCNLLGNEVEQGLLPEDMELIGGMVEDICYKNAVKYFDF